MKYLETLNKRGLSIENLPKALQKKIKDLEFQVNAYNEINENEDLSESDLEEVELIKNSIDEIDNHIAHKVSIFDQAKYDAKLENISKMKKAKEGVKEVKKEEVKEPIAKVVSINQEQEVKQPIAQPTPQIAPQTSVQPKPQAHQQYEEEQEEEEFEKVSEGKPKKMTTGLILMGVGAFFLTWGAVNFFKSRK